MIPLLSRFSRIPLFTRAVVAGVGVASLVSLALPAPGRGHRGRRTVPPQPAPIAPIQPESRPTAGPLALTSLAVGLEPRVYAPDRRVVSTFITDDGENCHLVATARLTEGSGARSIHWTVAAPSGFSMPVEGNWTGPRLDVVLHRPGGNPSGLGGPLSLTVQARAQVSGQEYTARETLVQDEVDQLRQEYVDLERHTIPDRAEFMDAAGFEMRYARACSWLHFEDLNWSVNPTTRLRYSYAIIRPELVQGLEQVRRAYGGVVINSGYRNPVRQVEVHAPVRESLHQYGYAADLAVTPAEGRALPNEVDWRRLAEVACGAAAAKWVEPLASSAPNSPGCHVHLDYRPGPASSAPVRLRGQVVEAATGKPVAGVLVLLGAMPARTDANGFFSIRNVLSGGLHPVEVRADGYEPLSEPVHLVAWGSASARLTLRGAVQRPVVVSVARSGWADPGGQLLSVTFRIANIGGTEAGDVRLSIAATGATLVSPAPASLGVLPAGAVRGVQVVIRPGRSQSSDPVLLATDVTFRREGKEETTRVSLLAAPPSSVPPGAGVRVARKPATAAEPKTHAAPSRPATPPAAPVSAPAVEVPEAPKSAPVSGSATDAVPSKAPDASSTVPKETKPAPAVPTPSPEPKPPSPAETKPPPSGAATEPAKSAGSASP